RTQSLEGLTRAFSSEVTRLVPVPKDKRDTFENYVRQQQLHRRYREGQATAEIQDILLSDPALPSHTGAITGELDRKGYRHAVYVEIPTWAARLRLVRQQNYTLTDRGRVLLLAGKAPPERSSAIHDRNPLHLSAPEQYVSLFCLLDIDGDLLTA